VNLVERCLQCLGRGGAVAAGPAVEYLDRLTGAAVAPVGAVGTVTAVTAVGTVTAVATAGTAGDPHGCEGTGAGHVVATRKAVVVVGSAVV